MGVPHLTSRAAVFTAAFVSTFDCKMFSLQPRSKFWQNEPNARGQHAAELQRQLDGRNTAGRQEAGHDGWAGGELRTVQEGLRDQSRLAGSPLSLRESEFSPGPDGPG